MEDTQTQQKHIDRSINHVYRSCKLKCLACLGFWQEKIRAKCLKRHGLSEISSNARSRYRGGQSWYGCAICDVAICNKDLLLLLSLHKLGGGRSTLCSVHFNWLGPLVMTCLEAYDLSGDMLDLN